MNRMVKYSFAPLLAVALSTSPIQCSNDDSRLTSLEVEAAGQNRLIGFQTWVKDYTIGTTEGVDSITVRANAASASATVEYDLPGATPDSGSLPVGGGEATLMIPANTPVSLSIQVTDGASTQIYTVEINRSCTDGTDCDDGNDCRATSCNASAVCDIMQVADGTPCYFHLAGGGICGSGDCVDNTQIVHFEDFGPAENSQRFGVELPAVYEGFEWAYADPLKIADSTCTTATATTCWGSWAVSDSSGDGVSGATGENWLRARSADQGKGAKITKSSGFVFLSMMLYTADRTERPAFVEEVHVTARIASDPPTDITTTIPLQADTWIEVTAGDLGVAGLSLQSIWFNTDVSSPNAGKFGLDNFTVLKN